MFNIWVDYPTHEEEIDIVKSTTADNAAQINSVLSADEILRFQRLVRKIPVADNVTRYAVDLAAKTRPGTGNATQLVNDMLSWGAGPRASQYLMIGAKCHAALTGKYSPDIEDVQAVALPILRHRLVRNYKAEAEGVTVEKIIKSLL